MGQEVLYKIKRLWYWFKEFGASGMRLARAGTCPDVGSVSSIWSRQYGTLYYRHVPEDVEAINTVICFRAYEIPSRACNFQTIVDLGGNIGIATRYLTTKYPQASAVAIEPHAANCIMFERNTSVCGDRVRLIRGAVGPESGKGWVVSGDSGRLDSLHIDFCGTSEDHPGATPIDVLSLQEICSGLAQPILLKMDIEGAELELLERRSNWERLIQCMMIEFHSEQAENRWVSILKSEGWAAKKSFDTWHFERL